MVVKRLLEYAVLCGPGQVLTPLVPLSATAPTPLSQLLVAPVLTDRYPQHDYADSPLPDSVAMFCFPHGISLKTSSSGVSMNSNNNNSNLSNNNTNNTNGGHGGSGNTSLVPKKPHQIHHFILTGGDGSKVFAVAITCDCPVAMDSLKNVVVESSNDHKEHKEPVFFAAASTGANGSIDAAKEEGRRVRMVLPTVSSAHRRSASTLLPPASSAAASTLYAPRCLCLLSRYDFFEQFSQMLEQIFTIVHQHPNALEPLLRHIMREIPVPPYGRISVTSTAFPNITFSKPPPNILSAATMDVLLKTLDVNMILSIWTCLLCENRVVLFHPDSRILVALCQAFCDTLFPLHWCHVLIPVLPSALVDFLHAPVPFLIGIPSMPADLEVDGCVFVDVAKGRLSGNPDVAPLPQQREKLRLALKAATTGQDLRLAFLRFWVSLLTEYRTALRTNQKFASMHNLASVLNNSASNANMSMHGSSSFNVAEVQGFQADSDDETPQTLGEFDAQRFMKEHPPSDRPFLSKLMETQAWHYFIQQRTSTNNDLKTLHDIAFFDESIVQKKNRSKLKTVKEPTPFLDDMSYSHHEKKEYSMADYGLWTLPSSVTTSPAQPQQDASVHMHTRSDSKGANGDWSTATSALFTPSPATNSGTQSSSRNVSPTQTPLSTPRPGYDNAPPVSSSVPAVPVSAVRANETQFPPQRFVTDRFGRVAYVKPLVSSEDDESAAVALNALVATAHRNPLLEALIASKTLHTHLALSPSPALDAPFAYSAKAIRMAVRIQRVWSAILVRRRFLRLRGHAFELQRRAKARFARQRFLRMRTSAVKLQSWWRCKSAQARFLEQKSAATRIASWMRAALVRKYVYRTQISAMWVALWNALVTGGMGPLPPVATSRCMHTAYANGFPTASRKGGLVSFMTNMCNEIPAAAHAWARLASSDKAISGFISSSCSLANDASVSVWKNLISLQNAPSAATEKKMLSNMHSQRQKEKKEIYRNIKAHASQVMLMDMFASFGVDSTGKARKRKLVKGMFSRTQLDHVRMSANFVEWALLLPTSAGQYRAVFEVSSDGGVHDFS
jgi:hypothetical protein